MNPLLVTLYVLLILSLFSVILFTLSHIREKDILKKVLIVTESRYEKRKYKNERIYLEEGNIEEVSFLDRLDILIERSDVRKYIPFMTTEIFLLSMLSTSIVGFLVSKKIYDFIVINLAIAFLISLGFYLFLYITSGITYERVDNNILLFINHLENFSATTDDVVTLFEKVIPYTKEPLKQYVEDFVNESKSGDLKLAFRNFEKKIENKRFKTILSNLEIASRHEANYKDILSESRIILKGYFESKERNKSTAKNGRTEIMLILFMSIMTVNIMSGVTPNLLFDLRSTLPGNLIILYCVVILLIVIWNFIAFDKE